LWSEASQPLHAGNRHNNSSRNMTVSRFPIWKSGRKVSDKAMVKASLQVEVKPVSRRCRWQGVTRAGVRERRNDLENLARSSRS
jgi:hypothetical protein